MPKDLQSVINNDLFASEQITPTIKSVLDFMEGHAQPLAEKQIQAIAYLNYLGQRDLHSEYRKSNGGKSPYTDLIRWISESAKAAAPPRLFIDTIRALIPRPEGTNKNEKEASS